MNCITVFHIVSPLVLALIYIYFIIVLSHIFLLEVFLLIVFASLFVLYSLALYALMHKQPGYENYNSTKNSEQGLAIDKIGQYKDNTKRLEQLVRQMRRNLKYGNLKDLQAQYIERYQQPSFCDICEVIKCPRTVHCPQCDRCILRREKHSQLIDSCIGQKNIKVFMQYLFISMVISLFMTVSLLLLATIENNKVDDFSDLQLTFFSIFEVSMGAAVLLFGKQFFISYFNARDNITETERKLSIITKKNNPFQQEKYYENMFQTGLDFFKISDIADPNDWIQFHDQNQIQNN